MQTYTLFIYFSENLKFLLIIKNVLKIALIKVILLSIYCINILQGLSIYKLI